MKMAACVNTAALTELFERRSLREKMLGKDLGPDQPDIKISQQVHEKGKTYQRGF